MEARIDLPDGGGKWVIVAGQPLEVGDEACMLFTFADLERQKKAEASLRDSEERFEKAFKSSPSATILLKASDFTFVAVNDAFATTFGRAELDVIGRAMGDIGLWAKEDAFDAFKRVAIETGLVGDSDECFKTAAGDALDCAISGVGITVAEERCLLCTILDITERKRSERDLVAAIDQVMADTSWFSRGLIEKLAGLRKTTRNEDGDAAAEALTKRERQVLQFICQGVSDAKIADRLKLSPNTVRNHIAALYRKLGVHNRTEAALWGHARGFSPAARAALDH